MAIAYQVLGVKLILAIAPYEAVDEASLTPKYRLDDRFFNQ
jgi:hypothetical protein